jgi:uncharacterized RDD family membrane protein YckC
MQWHFAIDGVTQGPVSGAELAWMAQQGAITDDTLVWREGLAQWQRFAEIAASLPPPAPRAGRDHPDTAARGEQLPDGPETEPRLLRSPPVPGPFGYGGFWRRLAARLIDTAILAVVVTLAGSILDQFIANAYGTRPDVDLVTSEGNDVLILVLVFTYEVLFVRIYNATPGKMALGLKILRADGSRLRSGTILGREWARSLSGIILGIGYLMAGFDDEKRALHDRLCDTRVIRTR